jgi:hypothetical protein
MHSLAHAAAIPLRLQHETTIILSVGQAILVRRLALCIGDALETFNRKNASSQGRLPCGLARSSVILVPSRRGVEASLPEIIYFAKL